MRVYFLTVLIFMGMVGNADDRFNYLPMRGDANIASLQRVVTNHVETQCLRLQLWGSIIGLANLCPSIDGAVILHARSLYGLVFEDYKLWSDISCDPPVSDRFANKKTAKKSAIISQNQQYSLTPNPNDGYFTIQQLNNINESVNVEIMNATGICVYKGSLSFIGGISNLMMQNKIPGLYLLKITDKKGNSSTLKFIVE